MENREDSRYQTGNTVCDAFRFMCDASFAILPRDVAHRLGEFEKNFWGSVRWFADKQVGWIDDCLSGGDRLREQWQRRYDSHRSDTNTAHTTYESPENI